MPRRDPSHKADNGAIALTHYSSGRGGRTGVNPEPAARELGRAARRRDQRSSVVSSTESKGFALPFLVTLAATGFMLYHRDSMSVSPAVSSDTLGPVADSFQPASSFLLPSVDPSVTFSADASLAPSGARRGQFEAAPKPYIDKVASPEADHAHEVRIQAPDPDERTVLPPCGFAPSSGQLKDWRHGFDAATIVAQAAALPKAAPMTDAARQLVGDKAHFTTFKDCQLGAAPCRLPVDVEDATFQTPEQRRLIRESMATVSASGLLVLDEIPEGADRSQLGGYIVAKLQSIESAETAGQFGMGAIACTSPAGTAMFGQGEVLISPDTTDAYKRRVAAHEFLHAAGAQHPKNLNTYQSQAAYPVAYYEDLPKSDFAPGHPIVGTPTDSLDTLLGGLAATTGQSITQKIPVYSQGLMPVDIEYLRALFGNTGTDVIAQLPVQEGENLIQAIAISDRVRVLHSGPLALIDVTGKFWGTVPRGHTYTRHIAPYNTTVQAVTMAPGAQAVVCAGSATDLQVEGQPGAGSALVLSADPKTGDATVAVTPEQLEKLALVIEGQAEGSQVEKRALSAAEGGGTEVTLPSGKKVKFPNLGLDDVDGVIEMTPEDCAGWYVKNGGAAPSSGEDSTRLAIVLGSVLGGSAALFLSCCSLAFCGGLICCVFKRRRARELEPEQEQPNMFFAGGQPPQGMVSTHAYPARAAAASGPYAMAGPLRAPSPAAGNQRLVRQPPQLPPPPGFQYARSPAYAGVGFP